MRQVLSGLIDIGLRPRGEATLTRQLYDELREAILDGALKPGRRLPSSRDLARQLKVSRNTVSSVIDQLAMEGYLDVAQGRRPVIAAAKPALGGRQAGFTGRGAEGADVALGEGPREGALACDR